MKFFYAAATLFFLVAPSIQCPQAFLCNCCDTVNAAHIGVLGWKHNGAGLDGCACTFAEGLTNVGDSAVCIYGAPLTNRVYSRSSSSHNHQHTIRLAVQSALRQAQLEPKEIQVVEVRSRSDANARQALSGEFDFTPREPKSKREFFAGTTGLAGLCALVWQLRGWTGEPPARIWNCLQATVDSDGAASVMVLRRSDNKPAQAWSEIQKVRDGRERLGYNPAVGEMRDISHEDLLAVRSKEEFTQDNTKRLHLYVKGGDRAALARL